MCGANYGRLFPEPGRGVALLAGRRDGHFWQFLISIIDRFQKRLLGGAGRVRGMAVMEIMKISEDCYENEC